MELIAACGIVCSECSAYKATQSNDPAAIEKVAQEWGQIFNAEVKPESVWCDGCLSDSDRKCGNCAGCSVRRCVVGRGLANCAECDNYGCETITEFLEVCPEPKEKLAEIRAEKQGYKEKIWQNNS
ncbi:MAG: DUF3795 domain-containing protein [Armatimonadetes bacterium]|nr:DUF3795 domain-containing protein [Armatimonadota bacterium]